MPFFLLYRMWKYTLCACVCGVLALAQTGLAIEPGAVVDGRAILKMGWGDNLCALTFDDGPSQNTERLLDILKERGIKATFFVVGRQVQFHPDIIRRLQAEGHEIGNHTKTHANLRRLPPDAQRMEIVSVQNMLRDLGVTCRYIRPPYGNYDKTTVEIAKEQGAGVMLWSIDSMDWSKPARIENMRTLISGQKLRGVFLFHDTHAQTVDAMPAILDRLLADGCRFVTVTDYLREAERQTPPLLQATQPPAGTHPLQKATEETLGQPSGQALQSPEVQQTPAASEPSEIRQPFENPNKDDARLAGHSTVEKTSDTLEISLLKVD